MAIMILMRVLLDHAMLEVLGMAKRNAAPNWRAQTVESRLQMIEVVRDREEAVKTCAVEEDDGGRENCDKSVGGLIISNDASSEIKKFNVGRRWGRRK